MSERVASRTLLLLVFAAAAAGALVQDVRFDTWIRAESASTAALDRDAADAAAALAKLDAAHAGYVAAGQGADFWIDRATTLSGRLDGLLTSLDNESRAADAPAHYEAAAAALQNLEALDRRARDYVTSGQRFLASDLIFTDALEASRTVSSELSAARDAERAGAEARLAKLEAWRLGVNAAALAIGLVVLIVAVRKPRADAASADTTNVPADAVLTTVAAEAWKPGEAAMPLDAVVADPWPGTGVDLSAAAELCVDLARVLDARDLPALLSRTAGVLDAKGVVLWVADAAGAALQPSLAHGYSDSVLQRMGTLPADADNVTSLAFRSLAVQTVAATTTAAGAIAVPLITPKGAVGVLAAEIPAGGSGPARSAVARMIAAQLATIVSPAAAATDAAPLRAQA